ncbi:hypothetical protein, partial [Xanthomonas maliensis]|uniref:hypothetical protein n=1 Tax=Xanthomonas maliensis TaxID=1321368 RepID=UPI001EE1EBFC
MSTDTAQALPWNPASRVTTRIPPPSIGVWCANSRSAGAAFAAESDTGFVAQPTIMATLRIVANLLN